MSLKLIITIALLSFGELCAQNTSPVYGNDPEAGSFYIHDNVKIYYEVYGHGKPFVILHGNGGSIAISESIQDAQLAYGMSRG